MHARCRDLENEAYGGRGISVAARWSGDGGFERFLSDLGPSPSRRHSLGRIDNDGNYEPGNVRWETPAQQNRNTRRTVWLEHNGSRMVAADWAKRLGISRQAIEQRIAAGWPVERICGSVATEPKRYTHGGVTDTVSGWASRVGVPVALMAGRLARGVPFELALSAERMRPKHGPHHCSECGAPGHNKATCERRQARRVA
jgi:hypothetical protein